MPKRLRIWISCWLLSLALTRAASATLVDMAGIVTVTPLSGSAVVIHVDQVTNLDLFTSGTLRLEYWVFPLPFDGGYQFGYQIAVETLGQLLPGYYVSNINRVTAATPPPYGFWYPALVLTEFTYSGYEARDWAVEPGSYFGYLPASDFDQDGWSDFFDNCPLAWNPTQSNSDGDVLGDACDACPNDSINDADGDGRCGNVDNCPTVWNPDQGDADGDSIGNACDACGFDYYNADPDLDGICGGADNCPAVPNPGQANADEDSFGDACDACIFDTANDADRDSWCANSDNCPLIYNYSQQDRDADGLGDACDPTPIPESDASMAALAALLALLSLALRRRG